MSQANRHALGGGVRLNARFTEDGTLVNPTSIELTVRAPSGADSVYTWPPDSIIQNDGTGVFFADLVPAEEGVYLYRWVGDEPQAALEGRFEVYSQFTATPEGLQRTYTYDLSNAVGLVRFHTDDRDLSRVNESLALEQRSAVWSDEEIQAALDAVGGSVLRASARLLRVLAVNRNLLVQSRRIGKTDVDYGNVRRDLLDAAKMLEEQDANDTGGAHAPADGIAEQVWDDFSLRHVVVNAASRDY